MDFTYNGDGTMILEGCAITSSNNCYATLFDEGDVVYLCERAQKGILEPVAIRHIKFISKAPQVVFLVYVDTYNATHQEFELCDLTSATTLVNAFNTEQILDWRQRISELECSQGLQ